MQPLWELSLLAINDNAVRLLAVSHVSRASSAPKGDGIPIRYCANSRYNNDICPPGGQNASQSRLKLSRWLSPSRLIAMR